MASRTANCLGSLLCVLKALETVLPTVCLAEMVVLGLVPQAEMVSEGGVTSILVMIIVCLPDCSYVGTC